MDVVLTDLGIVCALGNNKAEVIANAKTGKSPGLCYISDDILNEKIPFFSVKDCPKAEMRCYALLDMAVSQIEESLKKLKQKYQTDKIGVVLGTSNTGIHEAQADINQWIEDNRCPDTFSFEKIELGSAALYLKDKLETKGPAYAVSTACSSSAKAFQSARNLIKSGICEAVIVGGVDSRCKFAHNGFFALEALIPKITNPFSKNRSGITLGEGAALFIMEKQGQGIRLLGIGESTDGCDLTHPDPTGKGAKISMEKALADAHISPSSIDYINMHGTGTLANDEMEGKAIYEIFKDKPLCASTKPLTGHALGASGAIEIALSYLMLTHHFIIEHKFDGIFDESIPPIHLAKGKETVNLKTIMSNSFAFGGSNVSVILGENNVRV